MEFSWWWWWWWSGFYLSDVAFFELGTVYTVVAGLLNVLVICDAAGGPLVIRPAPKKEKPAKEKRGENKQDDPNEASASKGAVASMTR